MSTNSKCSAYTHVFADTVRSLAVLIASIIGQFVGVVTPEVADASAAIVVSAVIILVSLPLLSGMYRTSLELYDIRREERSEMMMLLNSGRIQQGHEGVQVENGTVA